VQLAKKTVRWKLINHGRPARIRSIEDNTVRDPIDGKVSGLKLFSIRF